MNRFRQRASDGQRRRQNDDDADYDDALRRFCQSCPRRTRAHTRTSCVFFGGSAVWIGGGFSFGQLWDAWTSRALSSSSPAGCSIGGMVRPVCATSWEYSLLVIFTGNLFSGKCVRVRKCVPPGGCFQIFMQIKDRCGPQRTRRTASERNIA